MDVMKLHTLIPNAVKIDILYSIDFMPQFVEQEIAPRQRHIVATDKSVFSQDYFAQKAKFLYHHLLHPISFYVFSSNYSDWPVYSDLAHKSSPTTKQKTSMTLSQYNRKTIEHSVMIEFSSFKSLEVERGLFKSLSSKFALYLLHTCFNISWVEEASGSQTPVVTSFFPVEIFLAVW